MFGLIISDDGSMQRDEMTKLLAAQWIPFMGFTHDPACGFEARASRADFLRCAAAALMQPGQPLPMAALAKHLSQGDALPGNVIRKYVCLQLSLLPYLRTHHSVTQLDGCFLVGRDVLVAPLGEDGRVEAYLPQGVWTELATGECFAENLRRMRGLNEMPVLARENALIPIGVDDRRTDGNDADRVTLHWFQPQGEAVCTLAKGITYHAWMEGRTFRAESDSDKPWHLIVHQNGEEILVK